MTEQVFQTRYETYRTAVEAYLQESMGQKSNMNYIRNKNE